MLSPDNEINKKTNSLESKLNKFLTNIKTDGEYHYIGAASDPGEANPNFSLGEARLRLVRGIINPSPNAKIYEWPFGPLAPIELEQLLSQEDMKKMKSKINCKDENGKIERVEQVVQQFAMAAYCPVNTN